MASSGPRRFVLVALSLALLATASACSSTKPGDSINGWWVGENTAWVGLELRLSLTFQLHERTLAGAGTASVGQFSRQISGTGIKAADRFELDFVSISDGSQSRITGVLGGDSIAAEWSGYGYTELPVTLRRHP